MKYILTILFFWIGITAFAEPNSNELRPINLYWATKYYISTSGSDSNPGTIGSPFRNISKIASLSLVPGDTVFIMAGTYMSGATSNSPQWHLKLTGKNGVAGNPIVITSYSGQRDVILDCSDYIHTADFAGIQIESSSYLHIRGIRVTGIPQRVVSVVIGWAFFNVNNTLVENCESDHIGNTGFRNANTSNFTYLNCDAHHIDNPYDAGVQKHGGSDGFGCYDVSNTSNNLLYKDCRAYWCSDDGWDINNAPGLIIWEGCWGFWNGYVQDIFPLVHTAPPGYLNQDGSSAAGDTWGDGNGFKLGGDATPQDYNNTKRILRRTLSSENYKTGYDQNQTKVKMEIYNNTAYKNGQNGFFFYSEAPAPNIVRNNIAYANVRAPQNFGPQTTQSNNSWNIAAANNSAFVSLDNSGIAGARAADGSLPVLPFMKLKVPTSGTNFIDAGVIVPNVLYSGPVPDLGAFEFSNGNLSPVAEAGPNQAIALPTSSVTLSGSATDGDGSIVSYTWTKKSGAAATIASPTLATTNITGLSAGTYVFTLTVRDDGGAVDDDDVTIVVNPSAPVNQLPVAEAGTNQTITPPLDSVTLVGSATDADGTISTFAWSKVSGPTATIVSASSATTKIRGLTEGTYVFRVTVTDNSGGTDTDDIAITVNPLVPPPVLNVTAGSDTTIFSPADTVYLHSQILQNTNPISTYAWRRSAYQGTATPTGTIATPSAANTGISGLGLGKYTFELTVKDNVGTTVIRTVIVEVKASATPPPDIPPLVLPVNFTSFTNTPTGASNKLTWKVAGETQVVNYIVEKATKPGSYSQLGIIKAAQSGTYTFTDNGNGVSPLFYRVKTLETGSNISYSKELVVNFSPPVITNKNVVLTVNSNVLNFSVKSGFVWSKKKITDINGKTVYDGGNVFWFPGTHTGSVNISGLSPGYYVFSVDGFTASFKK